MSALIKRVCRAIQGVLPGDIAFAVTIAEIHVGGLILCAGNASPEGTARLLRYIRDGLEEGDATFTDIPEPS